MKFQYTWYHIPTGKTGRGEVDVTSEAEFLRHLNQWNMQGSWNWLYYSENAKRPEVPAAVLRFPPTEKELVSNLDELIGNEPATGC